MKRWMPSLGVPRMALLCSQLAMLQEGGISILQAFELIAGEQHPRVLRHMAGDMADAMRAGATLAEAAREQGGRLPFLFTAMLGVGEMSGAHGSVLGLLSRYYDTLLKIRRALCREAAYPFFLYFNGLFRRIVTWCGSSNRCE